MFGVSSGTVKLWNKQNQTIVASIVTYRNAYEDDKNDQL